MNFTESSFTLVKADIRNLLPELGMEQARQEIITGLRAKQKYISSKYFYDKKGSALFEEITRLEEYYPTRTEKRILTRIAPMLMKRHRSFEMMELGSGDCSKISILLNALDDVQLKNVRYIPVDVSKSAVEKSVLALSQKFPDLEMMGYVADFTSQLQQIPASEKPRLVAFFGSTIGNFSPTQSQDLLRHLNQSLKKGDSLLIGFDLVKSEALLHAAYNDSRGITCRFSKNILNVANKIAGFTFDPDNFEHLAFYNPMMQRIEMHLKATGNIRVNSPFISAPLEISTGETIHVENSQKYSFSSIANLATGAGFAVNEIYTDRDNWFALAELSKAV